MKLAAAVLAALFLAYLVPGATGQTPARISVTLTVVTVHVAAGDRTTVYRIWNRVRSPVPIGHAAVSCHEAGVLSSCMASFHFPLGKIQAQGIRHSRRSFTLTLTGGTKRYLGVNGSVTVSPHHVNEPRAIFLLR